MTDQTNPASSTPDYIREDILGDVAFEISQAGPAFFDEAFVNRFFERILPMRADAAPGRTRRSDEYFKMLKVVHREVLAFARFYSELYNRFAQSQSIYPGEFLDALDLNKLLAQPDAYPPEEDESA